MTATGRTRPRWLLALLLLAAPAGGAIAGLVVGGLPNNGKVVEDVIGGALAASGAGVGALWGTRRRTQRTTPDQPTSDRANRDLLS